MKTMLKKCIAVVLLVVMILTLASCGSSSVPSATSTGASDPKAPSSSAPTAPSSSETYEINIGGGHAPTSSLTKCWEDVFIPRIAELSGGRIKVNFFANDQIGVETDRTEQTQLGTIQMTYVSEASASINPKMSIFALPFLFKDEAHFDKIIDGPIGKTIVEDFPKSDLHPLGFFENGFRVITNSKRPINTFKDMSGLKIRVSQSEIPIALFKAFGCNTVAMSFGELYSALQTGTVGRSGECLQYNSILKAL